MAASVRLHPLLVAQQPAPPDFFERPAGPLAVPRALLVPRSRWGLIPIPAFLIEHPDAGPILVDTGFDASVADDPRESLGGLLGSVSTVVMEREQAVPAQLRARGVDPADVRTVVMTHLHFDHSSGIRQFPHAEFVADRREVAAAREGAVLRGYRADHLAGAAAWRELDLDGEGFAHAHDLLGDGSIRLVPTPGHAPGHLSVLLRLRDREALLVGDAVYAERMWETERPPLFVDDAAAWERSRTALRRWIAGHPDALVVYGHDPDTWPGLAAAYE